MARRWLLLAAVALAACGDAEDTPPSADADAATLIEEAGPGTDSSGGSDADAKASDAGAEAAGPGPVFTDDFGDDDLEDDWEVVNVCAGCTAAIDQGSFLAQTKSLVAQETAFAHLRTTVPGTPSRVRLSFFATFPSVTLTQGTIAIATVDVSQNHFFSLYLRDGDTAAPGPVLEETTATAGTKRHVLANLPPAATKTRIVVDVDLGAGAANVSWDATVALANAPIDKTPPASDPTIRVGLMYVFGPQAPFEVRIDDVLLEYFY